MERDFFSLTFFFHEIDFNSHAHVERDFLRAGTSPHHIRNFNSHAHVERDMQQAQYDSQKLIISTHTLTWSVTIGAWEQMLPLINFNSHAHVERDMMTDIDKAKLAVFQLTRSRGA